MTKSQRRSADKTEQEERVSPRDEFIYEDRGDDVWITLRRASIVDAVWRISPRGKITNECTTEAAF